MQYGFTLIRIFPYKDRFVYGKIQVEKTRIFAYPTQWKLPHDNKKECILSKVDTTLSKIHTSIGDRRVNKISF